MLSGLCEDTNLRFNVRFRKLSTTLLLLALSATCAYARKPPKYEPAQPLAAEQQALVVKAIGREKDLIKAIQRRTPLVETYIQNIRPDPKLYQVPVSDQYMLSRVDFSKEFFDTMYESGAASNKGGRFKGSLASIANVSKALGLDSKFTYNPLGFTEMMFIDPYGKFDEQHYAFAYAGREFLGSVRTSVFDVYPRVSGMGRFNGRIWVEDQDGNIVRFNGTYTPPSKNEDPSVSYFHFDSWRMNVQPEIWLPAVVYVEETSRSEDKSTIGLKAQTHFWGYSLKAPARNGENVTVKVEGAEDKSDSQDLSPLQASLNWSNQDENNVIDRLVRAGLVAPLTPNGFETTVLEQVVTNLMVPNHVALPSPVHCRILLTSTLESTTVGNTILISKGLIDTMPRHEATIASVIAMQLAHIALDHNIDTHYAFNDRLLFPDESSFQRIRMYHTDHDNEEAAKKAQEYLESSMYKDQLPTAGLFWAQLADRAKALKELNKPRLGDSLLRPDGTPWMLSLARSAPKVNWDDLTQITALPLGSWLKTDIWDDRVSQLNATLYAPPRPRDKMPLEVTPVYIKLQRFNATSPQPAGSTPAKEASASGN